MFVISANCNLGKKVLKLLSLEQMQQIAKDRGGKCLSGSYKNAHTKLLWECSKGHRWEAKPYQVKQRAWCPLCAHTTKRTIEEMHQVAAERGGMCLSDTYVNNATKLLWECSEGHQWQATPNLVLKGYWCVRCQRLLRQKLRAQEKRPAK